MLLAAIFALAATLLPAPGTQAQTLNAPCRNNSDVTSLDAFYTQEEVTERLQLIEESSRGRVQVEVAGHSYQGREIYAARVGHGPTVVLVEAAIHGNEMTGTGAILNMLRKLGDSSPQSAAIREAVTVVAVPKVNPDGGEIPRRQNVMTWDQTVAMHPQLAGASRAWYYSNGAGGYDVNRDFNPDLDYVPDPADLPGNSSSIGFYLTPEAQTIREIYRDLENEFGTVDVFVDLHHQAPCYTGEGTNMYTPLSISGRFISNPAQHGDWPKFDYDASRRINVAVYDAIYRSERSPRSQVTLYPQNTNLPGTALGSFALRGSATILFEVSGQTQSQGQRKAGYLTNLVETGLFGILDAITDGTLDDIDPERYEEIPERRNVPRSQPSRQPDRDRPDRG